MLIPVGSRRWGDGGVHWIRRELDGWLMRLGHDSIPAHVRVPARNLRAALVNNELSVAMAADTGRTRMAPCQAVPGVAALAGDWHENSWWAEKVLGGGLVQGEDGPTDGRDPFACALVAVRPVEEKRAAGESVQETMSTRPYDLIDRAPRISVRLSPATFMGPV